MDAKKLEKMLERAEVGGGHGGGSRDDYTSFAVELAHDGQAIYEYVENPNSKAKDPILTSFATIAQSLGRRHDLTCHGNKKIIDGKTYFVFRMGKRPVAEKNVKYGDVEADTPEKKKTRNTRKRREYAAKSKK